ncbi:MAG: aldo/keto reductase [Candidatus Zixiibacteriota bacterium]|nr:MAG: aldo/keto reductase [candidate division Zixibacteria bacterium]
MNMRFLGNTGIKVSELCFGTMTFGGRGTWKTVGELEQKEADTLVGMALDAGINFFDTADIYSEGQSEEMLGKALGSKRKDVIVATKVRGRTGPTPNEIGLSRHHILEGCHASLKRLGTDYIDLYQLHSFDDRTPLDETLRTLDDLVRDGKVRYIGCSNFAGWQLMKALAISELYGLERFVTLQAYYCLVARELENELVPLCLDQGLGILPWSPLAGGFLSGKFRRGQPRPEGTRLSDPNARFLQFDEEKGFDIVDELERIGEAHNGTVAQAALNYLLRKPGVCSVIIGARTPEQLADNLKTVNWVMTQEEVARLDELSKPPRLYPYWMLEMARQNR